ncbi:hypothetical protein [Mycobacterium sp. NPDC050853]|uniref:hypothetical protein n=1 Tax=Mycobacterium sp. NPDC050853 TaxID=3155160 RepID=UPI0034097313
MSIGDVGGGPETRRQQRWRPECIETVAPLVDAHVKEWARTAPYRQVGELRTWRKGFRLVDTNPLYHGRGEPVTAANLARYKVVLSFEIDDPVFALCETHKTARSTCSLTEARRVPAKEWCPGCASCPM